MPWLDTNQWHSISNSSAGRILPQYMLDGMCGTRWRRVRSFGLLTSYPLRTVMATAQECHANSAARGAATFRLIVRRICRGVKVSALMYVSQDQSRFFSVVTSQTVSSEFRPPESRVQTMWSLEQPDSCRLMGVLPSLTLLPPRAEGSMMRGK